MAPGSDILLLDDHPEPDRALAEFIHHRCARRHAARSAAEAVAALAHRRTVGTGFRLVIANLVNTTVDGLALLRELQRARDPAAVILVADYHAIDAALEAEAQRLGALAILDRPVDLDQLGELIVRLPAPGQESAGYDAQPAPRDDATGALEPVRRSPPSHRTLPPTPAAPTSPPRPDPLALVPIAPARALRMTPLPLPPGGDSGTRPGQRGAAPPPGRVRRSLDAAATPPPAPPASSGIRSARPPPAVRSVTPRPPPPQLQAREVRCSGCGGSFRVSVKPVAYTTVCLHCGKMLRIDPA